MIKPRGDFAAEALPGGRVIVMGGETKLNGASGESLNLESQAAAAAAACASSAPAWRCGVVVFAGRLLLLHRWAMLACHAAHMHDQVVTSA